jgi:hypothetical protein
MLLTAAVGNDYETYTMGYLVGIVLLRVLAAPPVGELDELPKDESEGIGICVFLFTAVCSLS